jgi:hypothetical protein
MPSHISSPLLLAYCPCTTGLRSLCMIAFESEAPMSNLDCLRLNKLLHSRAWCAFNGPRHADATETPPARQQPSSFQSWPEPSESLCVFFHQRPNQLALPFTVQLKREKLSSMASPNSANYLCGFITGSPSLFDQN